MFGLKRIAINNLRRTIPSFSPPTSSSSLLSIRRLSYLDSWTGDDTDLWPRRHTNTIFNVCPEGEAMIIERLGSYHQTHLGGFFFAIPFVDDIRFVIDMRERALSIDPQSCITKDNVHVQVSGNLYCQFLDAKKAAYGAKNPLYAVRQHAQSSMRAAIGELELDQILHDRIHLNNAIRSTVQEAASNWGLDIKRYEITEVRPDDHIMEAMDKQAAAERERRKQVLQAEGNKRQLELESEGRKIQLANESEGELIRIKNEAEAHKQRIILEAEAQAYSVLKKAEAQSKALQEIALALANDKVNGLQAAQLNIARDYIAMYSDIGQKSNTMIFSERPADVQTLMAQANAVLNASKKSD